MDPSGPETDDSRSDVSEDSHVLPEPISDSAKLREAFQNAKGATSALHLGLRITFASTKQTKFESGSNTAKSIRISK
ncbi:hypothetical protein PCG10_005766 [Penicillium crustosum]|uniref:Uncharacterized protein n=1 Tax=Penicillium crustosum TaxID=36656 RepID=A0A9P5GMH1_PENCR|nr:hypothetical protein PCG10_005766 [Penicillium crustosum]